MYVAVLCRYTNRGQTMTKASLKSVYIYKDIFTLRTKGHKIMRIFKHRCIVYSAIMTLIWFIRFILLEKWVIPNISSSAAGAVSACAEIILIPLVSLIFLIKKQTLSTLIAPDAVYCLLSFASSLINKKLYIIRTFGFFGKLTYDKTMAAADRIAAFLIIVLMQWGINVVILTIANRHKSKAG